MNASQATFEAVSEWLKSLGVLCAGSMPVEEARMKCGAYATMLCGAFPSSAFTAKTLERVASRCKFFPAYAEVVEHLGAIWKDNLPAHIRMGGTQTVAQITQQFVPATPEELAHVSRIVAEETARLAASDETRKPAHQRVKPNHLHGLALAIARRDAGIPLSPELATLLAQHESRQTVRA